MYFKNYFKKIQFIQLKITIFLIFAFVIIIIILIMQRTFQISKIN